MGGVHHFLTGGVSPAIREGLREEKGRGSRVDLEYESYQALSLTQYNPLKRLFKLIV